MKSKKGFSTKDKFLLRDMIFITGLSSDQMNDNWIRSKEGLG